MIIGELDIEGVTVLESEAESPLLIDPDAPLAFAIALQRFQPVPWRNEQVLDGPGLAEVEQLAPRRPLDLAKARDGPVIEQRLRFGRGCRLPWCYRIGWRRRDSNNRHARDNAIPLVTCEYNIVPPNEPSRLFHDKFGFREQGTQWVASGSKRVSLQAAPA
jgi:hypothetical protein